MQVSFLIAVIIGLVVLLGVLFLFLFIGVKKKKESLSNIKIQKNDLKTLFEKINNKNSSTEELSIVVNTVLEDFAIIKEKDFNLYAQMLLKIARHPNANKDIILRLDRGLSEQNPTRKKEISDFTSQGLNAREV